MCPLQQIKPINLGYVMKVRARQEGSGARLQLLITVRAVLWQQAADQRAEQGHLDGRGHEAGGQILRWWVDAARGW